MYSRKHLLLLSIIQLICLALMAQEPAVVQGYVKDSAGTSLASVSVQLLSFPDSSLIASAKTNGEGFFLLSSPAGNSLLRIEKDGYIPSIQGPWLLKPAATLALPGIVLQKSPVLLDQVAVDAALPFVESRDGYAVLNMEATHSAAGSTAYDILKRAPGVSVGTDGAISLRGRSSVAISIDGKPLVLTGSDLADYLRGFSGDMIKEIALISNPSSQHEAAGSGGLINITLKKLKKDGTHADITLGTGYGERFKQNYGVVANHRKGKINIFGAWSFSQNRRLERYSFDRNTRGEAGATNFDLLNTDEKRTYNHSLSAGVDYLIKEKHSIGVTYAAVRNRMNSDEGNRTIISTVSGGDSSVVIRSEEDRTVRSNVYNLNYRGDFGKLGSIVADADYFDYNRTSDEELRYNFFRAGLPHYIQPELFVNATPAKFHIASFRLDYTRNLGAGTRLLAGIKLSNVSGDNQRHIGGNTWIARLASASDDDFEFNEHIYAAYLTYQRQFKAIKLEAGLRAEQTRTETHSLSGGETERSYLNMFPFLSVSAGADEHNKLRLVYSTRINRPAYDDLNPFIYFLDQYTFRQGNPYLRPEYAHTVELSNLYKEKLTIGISATFVKDYYLTFSSQDNATGVSKSMKQNLSDQKGLGLEILYSLNVGNALFSSFQAQGYYRKFSFRGEQALVRSSPYFVLGNNTTWKTKKGYSAELNFTYESATTSGMFDFDAIYVLSAGVGKSLLSNRAKLRLYVTDIFNTDKSVYHSNLPDMDLTGRSKMESRVLRLTASYRLGGKGGIGRQNRSTGNEQERRRLGN